MKSIDYHTMVKSVSDLTEEDRRLICAIYLKYYAGSSALQVRKDLTEKREILLLYYGEALVGFTTLQVYEHHWEGKPIRIVYSGDTVVEKAHWGQQALAYSWIARMAKIKNEKPLLPLYWFVIVKGHRTFKYLPAFAKSFYPHWEIDRSELKPLVDFLAYEKFGKFYNPARGVVEYPQSLGHLKDEIAVPTNEEMTKESVQFFLKMNPNYLKGHELVCLCELEESNMKPFTKRIFRKTGHDPILAAVG